MQAIEGYYKSGAIHPLKRPANIIDYSRVIITILDEPLHEKPNTWAALDRLVASMPELPRFEDFPRGNLGREPVNFEEA